MNVVYADPFDVEGKNAVLISGIQRMQRGYIGGSGFSGDQILMIAGAVEKNADTQLLFRPQKACS